MKNLLSDIPDELPEELTETLLRSKSFRVERIVSLGHASPQDFWYDQPAHEGLLVLSGFGVLRFQDPDELIQLFAGDVVNIPVHRKHRVEATNPDYETVWLAIFYTDDASPSGEK